MTCVEVERLVDAFADGELSLETSLVVEAHVDQCAACAARLSAIRRLSATLATVPRFRAPATLVKRIEKLQPAAAPARRWSQWLMPAAAAAALLLVAVGVWQQRGAAANATAEAVIEGHVRSLIAGHLMDVASTDRHTVKPWFAGRIDFSPTVVDLAADGFPLIGGRVDYIDRHTAAALVYKRRDHTINVFLWPETGGSATHASRNDARGYHLISWTRDGVAVWVVSDLAAAELQEFANKLDAAASPK